MKLKSRKSIERDLLKHCILNLSKFQFSCFGDGHYCYTFDIDDNCCLQYSFFLKEGKSLLCFETPIDLLNLTDWSKWRDLSAVWKDFPDMDDIPEWDN